MPDFYLDTDLSEIEGLTERQEERLQKQLANVAKTLSAATLAHLQQDAQQKLKTTRQQFLDALSLEQVEDGLWVITLDKKARWIDDGLPQHNQLPFLLNSPKAKVSKKGNKYITIPFKHNEKPQNQSPLEKDLSQALKRQLRNRNIPWRKIERNDDGSAKLGLIHSLNLKKPKENRFRSPHNEQGRHYLQGVRIYQKLVFNDAGLPLRDQKGQLKVKKGIFTFRTASSSQEGKGLWNHPGVEGKFLMDDAFKWALQQWENTIKPEIIKSFTEDTD